MIVENAGQDLYRLQNEGMPAAIVENQKGT
jgi:hypothetical protein